MAKATAKAIADVNLCKGCRLCVGACPVNAIEPLDEINKKGYKIINVNQEACIGCGQCYTICPDYVYTIKTLD
jgi:2-oxoglutarate ferredoxin oxidoreductase subunit delta